MVMRIMENMRKMIPVTEIPVFLTPDPVSCGNLCPKMMRRLYTVSGYEYRDKHLLRVGEQTAADLT